MKKLAYNPPSEDFPKAAAEKLLSTLPQNDGETESGQKIVRKRKCSVCGYIHEGESPAGDFLCPICKAPVSKFVEVTAAGSGNPYAGTKTEKNLQEAFVGESLARNKYTYFALISQAEDYEHLAEVF